MGRVAGTIAPVTPELTVAAVNVAGGRLLRSGGGAYDYDDRDRIDAFVRVLAQARPDVVVATELDCSPGSEQMSRLAEAIHCRAPHVDSEPVSGSSVPGVTRIGIGIASRHPMKVSYFGLPDPAFPLNYLGRERREWFPKAMGHAVVEIPDRGGRAVAADMVFGQWQAIHISHDENGRPYTYETGPGYEFGLRTGQRVRSWLEDRGVREAVVVGDLNAPDPHRYLSAVGGNEVRDAFGPGDPPATTPGGWSPDRALVTEGIAVVRADVLPVPGADHHATVFTFRGERWPPVPQAEGRTRARVPVRRTPPRTQRGRGEDDRAARRDVVERAPNR